MDKRAALRETDAAFTRYMGKAIDQDLRAVIASAHRLCL